MSKLTQRELLILLNERVGALSKKMDEVGTDHQKLRERVGTIETRHKTVSALWGAVGVVITIFLNAFKIFK
ncbi:hypothetical protein [Carboxylicivirga linearis]|uniref:Hemolysin XhlA n=1 Tax=Carboxylicivirga linearis TaxID=1628157 RepID=A0ABS5K0R9_9BACT|nr:hypothetical protein [Carboxylicivirga linearis]MBS2100705.1 hypothetical protein [Carboxylicivirga linearis]